MHAVAQEVSQHIGPYSEDTTTACGRQSSVQHLDAWVKLSTRLFDIFLLALLELRLLHCSPIELKAVHEELWSF